MGYGDSFADVELSPYKWVTHSDKLMTLAQGGDVFPVTVELDLVNFCNHQCWWCVDPVHMNQALERSFVSQLLAEFERLGVEGIVYKGGGEPTLHGSFVDVIAETRSMGFEVGIVTNGSRLTGLYEGVVENASYLRVSIDGPTEALHHSIHRSNDFQHVLHGVDSALRLRKHREQRHPIIGLSFAVDYPMIDLVPEAVRLGDRLRVDYILLRPPFYEEVGRQARMTIEEKKMLLDAFGKVSRSYSGGMRIFIDYWISDADAKEIYSTGESPRRGRYVQHGANGIEHITGRCLASPLLAVVAADRSVYPCCNLRAIPEWAVGVIDYENGDTFERIWHGRRRKEVMRRIHNIECIKYCTHPMSRYNEVIEYLRSPQYHKGFV
jgi:MoaA/NifB/PqqE/SkfB family radical SAM enzyme